MLHALAYTVSNLHAADGIDTKYGRMRFKEIQLKQSESYLMTTAYPLIGEETSTQLRYACLDSPSYITDYPRILVLMPDPQAEN